MTAPDFIEDWLRYDEAVTELERVLREQTAPDRFSAPAREVAASARSRANDLRLAAIDADCFDADRVSEAQARLTALPPVKSSRTGREEEVGTA